MIITDNILPKEYVDPIRDDWNTACLRVGIPAISLDAAAKIATVLYLYGNNEDMVFNKKLLADLRYIQQRFHLCGGESPDPNFVSTVKHYTTNAETADKIPTWAIKLFREWYNIDLKL